HSASRGRALGMLRIAEIPDQRLPGLRIGKADHAVAVRIQNVALGQGPVADPRLRVAVHRQYASELRVGHVSDGAEHQALLFAAEHPVMAVLIDRIEGSRIVREYGAVLGNDLATKFVERNLGSIDHLEEAELSTILAPGIRVGAWHEEARDEER